MTFSVLVATPTVTFGDLIQHTLEEFGQIQVKMAYTFSEAVVYAGSMAYAAALLDADLGENEYRQLADRLLARDPDIKLVVFPPGNDMRHASLQGLPDPKLLPKPFYLPDLVEIMARLQEGSQPAERGIAWVDAARFEQLLAGSAARVGVVCEQSGAAVFAGYLPEGLAGELSGLAQRFWQRVERSDLVRFDRLEAGQLECLFYLTAVTPNADTALGVVFPVTTPLSKVRAQVAPLVQALRESWNAAPPPPAAEEVAAPAPVIEPEPVPLVPQAVNAAQHAQPAPLEDVPLPLEQDDLPDKHAGAPSEEEPDWVGEEAVFKNFSLADLLGSIPAPDPNGSKDAGFSASPANGWLPELMVSAGPLPSVQDWQVAGDETGEDAALVDPDLNSPVAKDEQRLRWEKEVVEMARSAAQQEPEQAGRENAPIPGPGDPPGLNGTRDELAAPAKENDNRDNVLSSLTSLDQLEPVAVGMSLLNYTCVLIPRLPGHFLTGELSEKLAHWVQQLCLAFGWRLEGISLRPEYLQWTVQVTPSISPGNVVKIIRQRTSDYIFRQYDALSQENPSGDFWANGYLIVSGAQPPSVSLLRDYIAQTRRRQGVGRIPGDHAPRLSS